MRFLFIEDDRQYFDWLKAACPSHECKRIQSVEELTTMEIKGAFDAVFLDVKIPGQDTMKMAGVAKALSDGVPVIILTGSASRVDFNRVADGLITKDMITDPEHQLPCATEIANGRMTPQSYIDKLLASISAVRHGAPA